MNKLIESKQLADSIVKFLKKQKPLSDGHMVDYFTYNLYEDVIPKDMRDEISTIGYYETVKMILNNDTTKAPILHNFITIAKQYSLYNLKDICTSLPEFQIKLKELTNEEITGTKLDVFMKSKKAHEVEVLSAIAAAIKKVANTSHLIDIGDGKGYLSSLLALNHQVPVLGVDASYVNTTSAINRVSKLEKHWHHIMKKPKNHFDTVQKTLLYKQVTQIVTEETNFDELISTIFLEKCEGIGLIGLHTCGNLGPCSIHIFNNNNNIKSICNVSCCYHLLNENYLPNGSRYSNEKIDGFPISEHLLSNGVQLGRAARMLSAQSIDRILHNQDLPNKVIFYRAIFEVVLNQYCKSKATKNVGKFRREPENFVDYCREAFKRVGVETTISDELLTQIYTEHEEKRVELNIFHLIRSMLAPAIECLILLDRYIYLLEQGHENVFLVQLFDPVISPRCYGLIAIKS